MKDGEEDEFRKAVRDRRPPDGEILAFLQWAYCDKVPRLGACYDFMTCGTCDYCSKGDDGKPACWRYPGTKDTVRDHVCGEWARKSTEWVEIDGTEVQWALDRAILFLTTADPTDPWEAPSKEDVRLMRREAARDNKRFGGVLDYLDAVAYDVAYDWEED